MKLGGTVTKLVTHDVRFPTSREHHGSDAMNVDPDYSAAYVVLKTDQGRRRRGPWPRVHPSGAAPRSSWPRSALLEPLLVGTSIAEFAAAPGELWKRLTGGKPAPVADGPEKGVIHLATAAVVNALWDLWAKLEKKPLWKLLSEMSPRPDRRAGRLAIHDRRAHAAGGWRMLERLVPTRAARERQLIERGYPAYTTSVRVARVLGRADPHAVPRGDRRGLRALQGQSRGQPRGRLAPRGARARADRAEPDAHVRREPAVGRAPGHRMGAPPRRVQAALDRRAHEPGRRAGPRDDRPGPRAARHRRRHRRALPEPRRLQAAPPGLGDHLLPDRLLPSRGGERGGRGAAPRGALRRARLPARRRRRPLRVRAARLDASTISPSPARSRTGSSSTSTTSTSTSSIRSKSVAVPTGCPRARERTSP